MRAERRTRSQTRLIGPIVCLIVIAAILPPLRPSSRGGANPLARASELVGQANPHRTPPEISRDGTRGGLGEGARGIPLAITGTVFRGDRQTPAVGRPIAVEFFDDDGELLNATVTTNGVYQAALLTGPGETLLTGRVVVSGSNVRFQDAELPFAIDADEATGPDFVVYYDIFVKGNPYGGNCACNDLDPCTFDGCVGEACAFLPRVYGDVDNNDTVNLYDLFCLLQAFRGDFSICSLSQADIHGPCAAAQAPPCCPDGHINLSDLFAALNALGGMDPCCGR